MTLTPLPPVTDVRGGVGGTAATYSAVLALARRFDDAGDRMRGWAARAGRLAADPALLVSAPLSPVTFAEAEAAVLDAATGVHGVLLSSVAFEADAVVVRATVRAFEQCDRLVAATLHAVDYDLGRSLGTTLAVAAPALLSATAVAVPVAASLGSRLPSETRCRLDADLGAASSTAEEGPRSPPRRAPACRRRQWRRARRPARRPRSAGRDRAVPPDGGRRGGRPGPALRRRGTSAGPASSRSVRAPRPHHPRSVADLMRHLDQTNDLSTIDRPGDQGTLEIQTLRGVDGSIRHVVYLPGTDDLTTTPLSQDADVRDLATDLRLVAGEPTTYAAGFERAMHAAGIGPDDPVLLVGHSQGGMEAAALLARGSPFHVTDVVTAGAPIAQVDGYPTDSHVLSLENRGDVVPLIDGADNPDARQHVTVQFDDHETSIAANHALAHYVRGGEAVDASSDPSVREQVQALHRRGYLGGRVPASLVFQVTR